MFSYISMNWRGKPLISHEVIVNLIAATTTQKGLKIEAEIDSRVRPQFYDSLKKQMDIIPIF